jgi:hypothetical protein
MFKIFWVKGNTREMWKIAQSKRVWFGLRTKWETISTTHYDDNEWNPSTWKEDKVFSTPEEAVSYIEDHFYCKLMMYEFVAVPFYNISSWN